MDITVSSRHTEVPPAVRSATIDKIGRLSRYLDGMDRAQVHFAEERNPRIEQRAVCEVTLLGHGHQVRAKVAATDQFAAIDAAVAKLEHQLHRLKTRLVARHHGKGHGNGRVKLATLDTLEAARSAATMGRTADGEVLVAEEEPVRVVKTKRFQMSPMSVDDAALEMELLGHQFYVFVRADTGETAVLYRRDEGDVGLIEVDVMPASS